MCHNSQLFKVQCLKSATTVALLMAVALLKNAHKHWPFISITPSFKHKDLLVSQVIFALFLYPPDWFHGFCTMSNPNPNQMILIAPLIINSFIGELTLDKLNSTFSRVTLQLPNTKSTHSIDNWHDTSNTSKYIEKSSSFIELLEAGQEVETLCVVGKGFYTLIILHAKKYDGQFLRILPYTVWTDDP